MSHLWDRLRAPRRRTQAVIGLAAAGLIAAVTAPLVTAGGTTRARSPEPASTVAANAGPPSGRCPTDTRPLPPDGVAAAAEAALHEAPTIYGSSKNLNDARIVQAAWALRAGPRGRYARVKCDRRTQRRTAVVWLEFPHERGASLKQSVLLVSRTPDEYVVWGLLH